MHPDSSDRDVPDAGASASSVACNYVGANADTVEKAVTIPLEEAINGVEGMRYMTSTSTNNGTSMLNVTFQTGYNLDIAAVDVQNRVASVTGRLPVRSKCDGHHHHQGEPRTLYSAPDSSRATGATRMSSFRTIWMFT